MSNRRNMTLLFLGMVVIMLGFGMVIPILPFYVTAFGFLSTLLWGRGRMTPVEATAPAGGVPAAGGK